MATPHSVTNYADESFPCREIYFREFLDKLREGKESLYLKDWHLVLVDPTFYETPKYFADDWLNEFCLEMNRSDYRFVYIGPPGSKTPLHSKVIKSV